MKRTMLVVMSVLITLCGCTEKKGITDKEVIIEHNNEEQSVPEDKEFSLSKRWGLVLDDTDIRPENPLLPYYQLRLNKEDYSLGYHPGGGPFAYGQYTIDDATVTLYYPETLNNMNIAANTYILNKVFPDETPQKFTYDPDYICFEGSGCLRSEHSIFFDVTKESPYDHEYIVDGIEIVKIRKFHGVTTETMKLRKKPYLNAETDTYNYQLGEHDFLLETYNIKPVNDNTVSLLLKGYGFEVTKKTAWEDTIDGITAPWYNIWLCAGPEDGAHGFWVFGGYVQKLPEDVSDEQRKKNTDLFISEALRLSLVVSNTDTSNSQNTDFPETKEEIEKKIQIAKKLYAKQNLIREKEDSVKKAEGYNTAYYNNGNKALANIVEFTNNDFLKDEPLQVGMSRKTVISILGKPAKTTITESEYRIFHEGDGHGYDITFSYSDDKVTKIICSFWK